MLLSLWYVGDLMEGYALMSRNRPSSISRTRKSRAMNVPVRPTPALQWMNRTLSLAICFDRRVNSRRAIRSSASGLPKSGHLSKRK